MISAKRVREITAACQGRGVDVLGIVTSYEFSQEALDAHRQEIAQILSELPGSFSTGASFLNMYHDKDGHHWGEHPDMEALMCLGLALGLVVYVAPREVWPYFPGSMPFLYIKGGL